MRVSHSFTGTGNGATIWCPAGNEDARDLQYAVSGSFTATVVLERKRPGETPWETVATLTAYGGQTITPAKTPEGGYTYRFRCSAFTSGTVVTRLNVVEKAVDPEMQELFAECFQGRIQRDSATQVSLQRYNGDVCMVAGEKVRIGSDGILLTTTDRRISATGADAGAAMTTSTLYYVYLSNSKAAPFPLQLRASTQAPVRVNGTYYLGATGNALNWRFVGYVYTDGSTNFLDSDVARHVVNYYNRQWKRLFRSPGYVDNDTELTWSTTSTVWANFNGGTGHQLSFIANGEDAVELEAKSTNYHGSANQTNGLGLQRDGSGGPVVAAEHAESGAERRQLSVKDSYTPAQGRRTAELMAKTSAGTSQWVLDFARNGAAADPSATYISGRVAA